MTIIEMIRRIRDHQESNHGSSPDEIRVTNAEMRALEVDFSKNRLIFPVDTTSPLFEGVKIMGIPVVVE